MISIIVPVYNTEKYLRSCLDSLINQNIDKEIIIVDDGSTDNSLSIAKEYESKYSFIKVFHQPNSGQSSARNKGLMIARGDYVFFCDSDDFIEDNTLERLEDICIKNDLDILKTGWETIDQNENIQINKPTGIKLNTVISSKEFFLEAVKHWYNVIPWNGLIKRKYIIGNNLYFPEGIQFEDNYYNLILFLTKLDLKTMHIDGCFYKVRVSNNSTTTSIPSPKKIYDQLENIKLMNDFIRDNIEDKELYVASKKAVSSLVFTMTSYYYRISKEYRKEVYKNIPRNILKESINYSMNMFQKIKIFMFTYFRILLDIYEIIKNR